MKFLQKVTSHPAWYAFWVVYTGALTIVYAMEGASGYAAFMGFTFGLWVSWTAVQISDWYLERTINREIAKMFDKITAERRAQILNNNKETNK